MLLEHHRTECWRQRQGHEGREADRDGNRQSELPVEDARHAAEEGNRHEDGREDDSDGDDWSLDFIHGALRRIDRRQALFHVLLDVLDDDDGIVDDEADGKDHGEECQCVDREVEHDERAERTDQGDRHGEQRDDRRAPVLQEDEDDKDDEQQCLELAHHLVRAPLLGEFDGRALQIAVVGLELCLEFLEQRERIGDGAGKACQHPAVVDAAHLARRRLHDRVLAKRHLAVTGDGRLAVLAYGADGRRMEL